MVLAAAILVIATVVFGVICGGYSVARMDERIGG
jgi:hypothetical protein